MVWDFLDSGNPLTSILDFVVITPVPGVFTPVYKLLNWVDTVDVPVSLDSLGHIILDPH